MFHKSACRRVNWVTQHTVESSPEVILDLSEKKSIRVLHVDDETSLQKIAKQCLEMQGQFQVDAASSVGEAFEKIEKERYDAVVSDYQMPGKDGLQFLKELRQKGNTIPFVMFTGKGREEVAVEAWSLGADHYVNKTGDPETVYCELAHCLRSSVEKHVAEARTKETIQKLQTIYQNAIEGISYVNSEENIVYANKAFADILGYEQDQLTGMSLRKTVDDENWAKIKSETERRRHGENSRYEAVFRRSDGTVRNVLISGAPSFDHDGQFAGTVGIVLDITEQKKAEEILRESEAKYRSLVEQSMRGIIVAQGPVPHLIFANAAMSKMLGYSTEELTSLSPQQIVTLVHPDDRNLFFDRFKDRLEGKPVPSTYEVRAVRKDGKLIWMELSSTKTVYNGQPAVQATFMDITDRKNAEETAKESEEKWHSLAGMIPDGIVTVDLKGVITSVNDAFLRLTGCIKEEIVGKHFAKLPTIRARDIPGYIRLLGPALRGKLPPPFEYSYVRKDRSIGWAEAQIRFLKDNGKTIGFQAFLRETTERHQQAEALRASEEKYRMQFEEALDAIFLADAETGILLDCNRAATELVGRKKSELVGKHQKILHPPEEIMGKFSTSFKQHLKEKEGRILETQVITKNGEIKDVAIKASVFELGDKRLVQGIFRDIAERKRFEERLSALNIHSRKLNTAGSMEEIYRLTLEAMEKTLGFEIAFFMVVDKDMLCLVDHRGYPENFSIKLPLNGTKRGVSVKVAKTGRSINVPDAEKEDAWVEFIPNIRSGLVVPVEIEHEVLGVIGVDSTELNAFDEKDQELLEILALHAATAMSNLEHAKNLEMQTRELRASQEKFRRLFTNNPEASIYLDVEFHLIDANPRFLKLFGYTIDEVKGRHINDVVVPDNMMEEAKRLDETAVKGYVYHDTVRKRKDGTLAPVSVSAASLIVEDKLIGYIGVYKDISEMKKLEEKLRIVGSLTRHDVRNKLTAVAGNAYLLRKRFAADRDALECLRSVETAIRESERIFDFAGAYEKLGVEQLAYVDAKKVLDEAVALFPDLKDVKIVNSCGGLTLLADSLLRQLFYNLIDDSLKYGEKLTQIRIHYEKPEDQLRLVYEDDGVGISKDAKPKLFSEGYTTGKGSGYGLYLIKRMIDVYGWTVNETGTHGKGTRFTLTIPKTNRDGRENYILKRNVSTIF
jgi:PAS domain S-box-containing protein